ncbi:MAG: hypothetical protein FWF84_07570, partial [Kiritimatiellaeota bacterium]|nr:hypothetical protein [Kiritimatiellota bacterium]
MRTRIITAATLIAAGIALADEAPNRLYEDYMARKRQYEKNVAQAKQDYASLGKVGWKVVIDIKGGGYRGEHGRCHIELEG